MTFRSSAIFSEDIYFESDKNPVKFFKCSTFSEAAHDASQKSFTKRLHVPPFDSGFITVDYSFVQKSVINDFPSIQPDACDSLSQQNEMFASLSPGH